MNRECTDLARRVPDGRLLNALPETGCARLSPAEVNAAYARAHVGLCLSPREGAMRVAMEYHLAGLPIVATPCRGGRDQYYDTETWTIVSPDPQAVREAVDTIKAKALPAVAVRARAVSRIERDWQQFVEFAQTLIDEEGGEALFDGSFQQPLWAAIERLPLHRTCRRTDFREASLAHTAHQ